MANDTWTSHSNNPGVKSSRCSCPCHHSMKKAPACAGAFSFLDFRSRLCDFGSLRGNTSEVAKPTSEVMSLELHVIRHQDLDRILLRGQQRGDQLQGLLAGRQTFQQFRMQAAKGELGVAF